MWELDCEEGWVLKNWCFWTVVLEKTLDSPLDCKEIQAIHSEGDRPWDFFGRKAKAETPVLCPPHAKSWLIGKDSDAGRDWGQEERDDRGWDGWMASLTRWTGRPGVLRFMGLQRVGHDWATDLIWSDLTAFTEENLESQMKNKCLCSYLVLSGQNPDKADSELRSKKILRNHYLSPLGHFWFSEWE